MTTETQRNEAPDSSDSSVTFINVFEIDAAEVDDLMHPGCTAAPEQHVRARQPASFLPWPPASAEPFRAARSSPAQPGRWAERSVLRRPPQHASAS